MPSSGLKLVDQWVQVVGVISKHLKKEEGTTAVDLVLFRRGVQYTVSLNCIIAPKSNNCIIAPKSNAVNFILTNMKI